MSRGDPTLPSPDPLLGARLRDAPCTDAASASVAKLLAQASFDPTQKSAQPWAKIEEKLTANTRSDPRVRWLWPAIATTSLLVATGAVAGPSLLRWVQSTQGIHTQHVDLKPAAAVATQVAAEKPEDVKSALPPTVPSAKPAVHTMKAKPRVLAMAEPVTMAPALPSALAEESKLLGTALASLRKDKDATHTLAILDDYQERFPGGELAGEAQRTRVEALLLQRRMPEALAVLDRMTFAVRARDSEWRVLRGELRASVHRCSEAQTDFSEVLKFNNNGAIAERALYGRASCLLELTDTPGARAALLDYAARFPAGAHAEQVRKALDVTAP